MQKINAIYNRSTDPIKINVIINSINRENLPEAAVKRNVIAVKTHELFKFIELSGDDRIANVSKMFVLFVTKFKLIEFTNVIKSKERDYVSSMMKANLSNMFIFS